MRKLVERMENRENRIQTKKSIRLVFIDENGKKHRWTPKFIREDIMESELAELAVRISALGLFESKGIPYLPGAVEVERFETIETVLFDMTESSKEESSEVMQPPMYTVGSRVVNIENHLKKRETTVVE